LRAPHGFRNPGGFDYEKWLFQQRIVATGYVRDSGSAQLLDTNASPANRMHSARLWVKQRLQQATADYQHGGLVLAIAIGDRSGIDQTQWQRFIATGTNHLLAISGLHISLVAAFVALLASLLWRRARRLQSISRYAFALMTSLLAALCYSALAGFSIPTQRALLMFAVVALLSLLARHQNRQHSLAIALAVVCALDPLSVLSAGFWMSFAAVAILFTVYAFIPNSSRSHRLLSVLRGHVLITIGLYPVGLLFFGQLSVVSPLANLIAVPMVGLISTPMIFVATVVSVVDVTLAQYLLLPVEFVLSGVMIFLGWVASWEHALKYLSVVSHVVVLWAAVIALLCLLPFNWRMRWLSIVLLAPLLFAGRPTPAPGHYAVTFLDVGQGTAVVVQTREHVLLYDTGARFSASFNAGDAVILPYLRSAGINRIDRLVISHADGDHSGGAHAVLEGIAVDDVWASAAVDGVTVDNQCRAGQQWQWDDVTFAVLHPSASDIGTRNDRSCVLLITSAGQVRTLLSGDIEARGEQALLKHGVPGVDILLSPHHGSASSSGPEFVAATRATHVVHTTGYRNRYGFPNPQVSEAYRAIGANQFNTAISGAITFTTQSLADVSQYRAQHHKLWHRNLPEIEAGE
ncbi:MAG: DNA internalization-related competence protein ComEC/Rec2, partial [Pseudomonadota bacterium]